jgi:hypothetical protein
MNPELAKRLVQWRGYDFSVETWARTRTPKQICLHDLAGTVNGSLNWWQRDGQPVNTPIIIGRDGKATQIYHSMRWGYALGLDHNRRMEVEEQTISVELEAWGWLTLKDGKYYNWVNQEVPAAEVCTMDKAWRGFKYFHAYTPEQIETTRLLCLHWGEKYGIPLHYKENELWNVSDNARFAKVGGVYTHASFRRDKTDISPQPAIIEMLKGLNK